MLKIVSPRRRNGSIDAFPRRDLRDIGTASVTILLLSAVAVNTTGMLIGYPRDVEERTSETEVNEAAGVVMNSNIIARNDDTRPIVILSQLLLLLLILLFMKMIP